MKKLLLLLAAGLMVGTLIIGCGTENPWNPDPSRPLELSFVAGPADTVAYGSTVTFSWKSKGGSGEVQYQYRLGSGSWSTPSSVTSVTYTDVTAGDVFGVMATDEAQSTQQISRQFWVGAQPAGDTTPPTVWITSSPAEDSYVATGSRISFTWDGEDDVDMDNLLFWYSFAGATSETTATRTVTFVNVQAADPATFSVWAMDQSGNPSTAATISFIIKDATILYVDDYQWLDLNGNVDMPKERDQKQFYRDALEGYAFAEWDIALQGMPDSSDLVVAGEPVYSSILFACDSDLGSTSGTMWFDVGAVGGGVLAYYLENGGNLLLTGALTILDMTQEYPPNVQPGDFEFDWLGLDSTAWCFDYWTHFTWAVKDPATTLNLPDSMKIDVAKNGDQDDYGIETPGLRQEAVVTNEVIFRWGLDVDGEPPTPYNSPVGHITKWSEVPRTVTLTFDTYSMPLPEISQTFHTILTDVFGE
jgi:hypothetical protein